MRINEIDASSDIQATLKNNCGKAFNSKVILYRGMHYDDELVLKQIRQDRSPLHSSKMQEIIFDTFTEACGFPHRKHNTVSFSNQIDLAKDFGNVYQVWAFDDAQYLYSTEFPDFIGLASRIKVQFDGVKSNKIHHNRIGALKEYIVRFAPAFKEEWGFAVTTDPNELHKAASEILVFGSSYVAKFHSEGY